MACVWNTFPQAIATDPTSNTSLVEQRSPWHLCGCTLANFQSPLFYCISSKHAIQECPSDPSGTYKTGCGQIAKRFPMNIMLWLGCCAPSQTRASQHRARDMFLGTLTSYKYHTFVFRHLACFCLAKCFVSEADQRKRRS